MNPQEAITMAANARDNQHTERRFCRLYIGEDYYYEILLHSKSDFHSILGVLSFITDVLDGVNRILLDLATQGLWEETADANTSMNAFFSCLRRELLKAGSPVGLPAVAAHPAFMIYLRRDDEMGDEDARIEGPLACASLDQVFKKMDDETGNNVST